MVKTSTYLLDRTQVIRLSRLLHMKYRPSEIAAILEVSIETVYHQYLASGCPHERDETGHIWIIGTAFREWAEDVIAKRKRGSPVPMDDDQTWCVTCGQRVKLANPTAVPTNRRLEKIQGECPGCGDTICRTRRRINANGTD